jgi:hypothetical protein
MKVERLKILKQNDSTKAIFIKNYLSVNLFKVFQLILTHVINASVLIEKLVGENVKRIQLSFCLKKAYYFFYLIFLLVNYNYNSFLCNS